MPLRVNDPVPDFSLPSTSGKTFNLRQNVENNPIVLYFYPKDFTPACTREACSFRDEFSAFKNLKVTVVGISRDTIETHHRFQKHHDLPFELLSDRSGSVARQFKALIPVVKLPRRISYLINTDMTIAAVYEDMFGAEKHIRQMLSQLS